MAQTSTHGSAEDTADAPAWTVTRRSANGEIVASPPPPKKGKPPEDWSFVWKPRWILSHLFVLSCVVAFVFLGLWQLSRYHGRVKINHMLETRMAIAPVPLQSLIKPHERDDIANHKAYRQVTVTGHYDNSNQILIRDGAGRAARPRLLVGDAAHPVRRLGRRHQPRVRAVGPGRERSAADSTARRAGR